MADRLTLAVQRRQERAFRRLVRTGLWACIMCPNRLPWVGTYDCGDEPGECPRCGWGAGIFRISVHGERAVREMRFSQRRARTARGRCLFPFPGVREAVAAGEVDRG